MAETSLQLMLSTDEELEISTLGGLSPGKSDDRIVQVTPKIEETNSTNNSPREVPQECYRPIINGIKDDIESALVINPLRSDKKSTHSPDTDGRRSRETELEKCNISSISVDEEYNGPVTMVYDTPSRKSLRRSFSEAISRKSAEVQHISQQWRGSGPPYREDGHHNNTSTDCTTPPTSVESSNFDSESHREINLFTSPNSNASQGQESSIIKSNGRLLCQHCGKTFTKSWALKVHLRIHTGSRPHRCELCGKGFTQSGDLQRHIRVHTGEKPFKCEFCGRGFSRMITRRHHQVVCKERPRDSKMSRNRSLTCLSCDITFSRSCDLQKHLRVHKHKSPNAQSEDTLVGLFCDDAITEESVTAKKVVLMTDASVDSKKCSSHRVNSEGDQTPLRILHSRWGQAGLEYDLSPTKDTGLSMQQVRDKKIESPEKLVLYSQQSSISSTEIEGNGGQEVETIMVKPHEELLHSSKQDNFLSSTDAILNRSGPHDVSELHVSSQVSSQPVSSVLNTVTTDTVIGSIQDEYLKAAKCSLCSKQFRTTATLEKHLHLHEILQRRKSKVLLSDRREKDALSVPDLAVCRDKWNSSVTSNASLTETSPGSCKRPFTSLRSGVSKLPKRNPMAGVRSLGNEISTSDHFLRTNSNHEYFDGVDHHVRGEGASDATEDFEQCNQYSLINTVPPYNLSNPSRLVKAVSNIPIERRSDRRRSVHGLTDGPSSILSSLSPSSQQRDGLFDKELVLKIRLANVEDKDFIEVDLDKADLTFENLVRTCCSELSLDRSQVVKVRKLPDTVVRRDKDVLRLRPYQELEIVFD